MISDSIKLKLPKVKSYGLVWRTCGILYMTLAQAYYSRGNCATTVRECYDWFKECGTFDENDYEVTINIGDESVVITAEDDWAVAFLTFSDIK